MQSASIAGCRLPHFSNARRPIPRPIPRLADGRR
jgi:hypothetical protein